MNFISTRNGVRGEKVTAARAVIEGIAPDGGLYVPEELPALSETEIRSLMDMDYPERAAFIISKFIPELNGYLPEFCRRAYSRFDGDPAPVVKVDEGLFMLELWHGPTSAFKDMALTLLPYLLTGAKRVEGKEEDTLILVATSGDTGKAALEGFKDVPGAFVSVFYPDGGVSELQKLQMQTQEGSNVFVAAVKGNFDDAQTAVKRIFADEEISKKLSASGFSLSSANSINFGRLVPQIAYYFSAYADLADSGEIRFGDKVDFCVPSGNFGNILAGFYAEKMGLPINKLICASNRNNVLTDFFATGKYDRRREFYKTQSPSMDILISSNLERLIFEVSGRDAALTASRMKELKETGEYSVTQAELAELRNIFYAGYADEEETTDALSGFFEEYGYAADPHTAVAVAVYDQYAADTSSEAPAVIVSTASPYKFPASVLTALGEQVPEVSEKALKKLEDTTAVPCPENLSKLCEKPKRFVSVIEKEEIGETVISAAQKFKE